jgi:hypothetical protein
VLVVAYKAVVVVAVVAQRCVARLKMRMVVVAVVAVAVRVVMLAVLETPAALQILQLLLV